MAIRRYLAMTAAEIGAAPALPRKIGYMACHFSPYGSGLTGLPKTLPPGSMLILNDRIPLSGHDPGRVLSELNEMVDRFHCDSLLLDFERSSTEKALALASRIAAELPCPVGIPAALGKQIPGPVFLPPLPCDRSLEGWLEPWEDREIWLEADLGSLCLSLTRDGCQAAVPRFSEDSAPVHQDSRLCCHYQIQCDEDAIFSLFRSPEDLEALAAKAETLGVSRLIGLYQELRGIWTEA